MTPTKSFPSTSATQTPAPNTSNSVNTTAAVPPGTANNGSKIGGSVGGAAGVMLLGGILALAYKHKKSTAEKKLEAGEMAQNPPEDTSEDILPPPGSRDWVLAEGIYADDVEDLRTLKAVSYDSTIPGPLPNFDPPLPSHISQPTQTYFQPLSDHATTIWPGYSPILSPHQSPRPSYLSFHEDGEEYGPRIAPFDLHSPGSQEPNTRSLTNYQQDNQHHLTIPERVSSVASTYWEDEHVEDDPSTRPRSPNNHNGSQHDVSNYYPHALNPSSAQLQSSRSPSVDFRSVYSQKSEKSKNFVDKAQDIFQSMNATMMGPSPKTNIPDWPMPGAALEHLKVKKERHRAAAYDQLEGKPSTEQYQDPRSLWANFRQR